MTDGTDVEGRVTILGVTDDATVELVLGVIDCGTSGTVMVLACDAPGMVTVLACDTPDSAIVGAKPVGVEDVVSVVVFAWIN